MHKVDVGDFSGFKLLHVFAYDSVTSYLMPWDCPIFVIRTVVTNLLFHCWLQEVHTSFKKTSLLIRTYCDWGNRTSASGNCRKLQRCSGKKALSTEQYADTLVVKSCICTATLTVDWAWPRLQVFSCFTCSVLLQAWSDTYTPDIIHVHATGEGLGRRLGWVIYWFSKLPDRHTEWVEGRQTKGRGELERRIISWKTNRHIDHRLSPFTFVSELQQTVTCSCWPSKTLTLYWVTIPISNARLIVSQSNDVRTSVRGAKPQHRHRLPASQRQQQHVKQQPRQYKKKKKATKKKTKILVSRKIIRCLRYVTSRRKRTYSICLQSLACVRG